LLLEHLLVGLHAHLEVVLARLENNHRHFVDMIEVIRLVHPQVRAHTLDQHEQVAHAAIDVSYGGVGCRAEQMR